MGPIQTALGQAMGAIGGAALVAKKLNEENEKERVKGQAAKEKADKGNKKAADQAVAEKALKTAQDKKLDSPKQILFDAASGEALGTSNEVASVLATQSLHNALSSKTRSRDKVRERKQMLAKRKLARQQ